MSYEKTQDLIGRLQDWLTKNDYTQGLRLYAEAFGENVTYRLLVRGQNSFNVKKLREALSAHCEKLKAESSAQLVAEPSSVAELRRNASVLMNERTALKAQIRMLDDEAMRFERAKRVLEIGEQLDDIYGQVEFFELNGQVWQAPEQLQKDDALRRYLNVRTYISRTAKALEVAILPKKKAELEKKLQELKIEKAALELTDAVKKYNGHAV